MRLLVALLCFLVGLSVAAPKKTEAQIKEQKNALKKLESDLYRDDRGACRVAHREHVF